MNPILEIEKCILAMAPIDSVITLLIQSQLLCPPLDCHPVVSIFVSITTSTLPRLVYSSSAKNDPALHDIDFKDASLSIPLSYIRKLILRFANRVETEVKLAEETATMAASVDVMDVLMGYDDMAWLWLQLNHQAKLCTHVPNPGASCHVSFTLQDCTVAQIHPSALLRIRIFPNHNDVGVRRVWEAGCCLAEYLYKYPHHVRDKQVFELGSGVGLTGLFVAKTCLPYHMHMTDVTIYSLDNLYHNLNVNRSWLESACRVQNNLDTEVKQESPSISHHLISTGYFNWKDNDCRFRFGRSKDQPIGPCHECHQPTVDSYHLFHDATVLLAADVLYDPEDIPYLVQTILAFLSLSNDTGEKVAIFAITMRNQETFKRFEQELWLFKIQSHYIPLAVMHDLPTFFPCYFLQPRSDVRIAVFSLSSNSLE